MDSLFFYNRYNKNISAISSAIFTLKLNLKGAPEMPRKNWLHWLKIVFWDETKKLGIGRIFMNH